MLKITDIQTMVFESPVQEEKWYKLPIQRPYTKYPEADAIQRLYRTGGIFVVKVVCSDGAYGYGTTGTYNVCRDMVERFFRPLLVGSNALEIERLWDVMFNASLPFGRRGAALMAISAIDTALWDIFGKETGLPVYQLLGGKVREGMRCYGTGPQIEQHKAMGYFGSKIPMPYGPEAGAWGMRENEARVRQVREFMGGDAEIMCDCWCGWDYPYTVRMAERLRPYGITWIEEPLMPDDLEGYRRLRPVLNRMGILLTTGEHEHTRWGARELIDKGCVDILQADVEYCGGVSELKKIMNYASAHHVHVIPHTPSVPGMHVIINSTASPCIERITLGATPLFLTDYEEKDGYVYLSDSPGFGIELNPDLTGREP